MTIYPRDIQVGDLLHSHPDGEIIFLVLETQQTVWAVGLSPDSNSNANIPTTEILVLSLATNQKQVLKYMNGWSLNWKVTRGSP